MILLISIIKTRKKAITSESFVLVVVTTVVTVPSKLPVFIFSVEAGFEVAMVKGAERALESPEVVTSVDGVFRLVIIVGVLA